MYEKEIQKWQSVEIEMVNGWMDFLSFLLFLFVCFDSHILDGLQMQ